ncbi:hypothetical protein [Flagellimonas onchidii]|uniref:hypothetical protein n=1 Tax=Flagellimonas onchidii TaxID=2562684 RepID=UPI0010A6952C|nr:hypothetical protein [Allomuricauda onchidii]
MEAPRTIYTVKGKNTPMLWEFRYDLEGYLTDFKILEGRLNERQIKWLFTPIRFPYREASIRSWKAIKNFEMTIGRPELTFGVFWNTYNYKVKKVVAQRAWERLSQSDKMNAIAGIKKYDGFLQRKVSQAKANPATYLNQRYWEDSYGSI